MWAQREQPDLCRYAFDLPMKRDPGGNHPIYGSANGRVVLSKDWVQRSTVRHGNMTPRIDIDLAQGYGYAWHFRVASMGERRIDYYWAGGNGGQLIIVIPDLDMVVGFTGGDYAQPQKYLRWEIEEMPRYILPTVVR